MQERFIVYTMNNCPYCEKAKEALKKANFKYEIKNIPERSEREDFYNHFNLVGPERTMPKMLIIADDKQVMVMSSNEIKEFVEQYDRI